MKLLQKAGGWLSALAEKVVPDPWVLAILLTVVTYALAVALTPTGAGEAVGHWTSGFWNLLSFGMQMVLILVTGHAVATSPLVSRNLEKLAGLPKTGGQAALLIAVASSLGALVNWGLGLVMGALLVREVGKSAARRGVRVHYPLLGAAGYAGLSVWHGGLSGSAPLLVASKGHFLEAEMGVIPVSATLGSALNLATCTALVVVLAALFWAFSPSEEEAEGVPGELWEEHEEEQEEAMPEHPPGLARRLDHSVWVGRITGFVGLAALCHEQWAKGAHLDLDTMNFALLFAAIFLHGSTRAFLESAAEGVKGTVGVILQFPFYAGIMGLMKGSGLGALFSTWLAGAASAKTLPLFVFLSAGLVNLFVPSGGGQWAIQGPIVIESARALGVPFQKMVMAVAYGDEWTNLIQPFWTLPLLGMTGLKASEILGYTAGALVVTGVVFAATLLIF